MKLHSASFASRVAARINTSKLMAMQASDPGSPLIPPSTIVGIPTALIITVITQVLPLLVKCFKPDDGAQAKQYLESRCSNGVYTQNVMTPTARRMKQAAEKSGGLLAYKTAVEFAQHALDETRMMDSTELSVMIQENK